MPSLPRHPVPHTGSRARRAARRALLVVTVVLSLLAAALQSAPAASADSCFPTHQPDGSYRCPAPGDAHLSGQFDGYTAKTGQQWAAVLRLEDEANTVVRQRHGMSDTPEAHDRVVYYAKAELRAALFGRLVTATYSDHPTPDEQAAVGWLVHTEQDHQVAIARAAKAQYDRWHDVTPGTDPEVSHTGQCDYQPPAPYQDEWTQDDVSPGCYSSYHNYFDVDPYSPTLDQFVKWGTSEVDRARLSTPTVAATLGTTSGAAIGLGTGVTAAAATGTGLAVLQTVNGYTNVVRPFVSIAAAAASGIAPAEASAAQIADAVLAFYGVADVAFVAGIVLAAVSVAVTAGITLFTADAVPGQLDRAISDAQGSGPDLRTLLGTDTGKLEVYSDLVAATPDVCGSALPPGSIVLDDGGCERGVAPALPDRQQGDPLLAIATSTGVVASRGPSQPVEMPVTGAKIKTVSVRDGWFVLDDSPTPLLSFPYRDWTGAHRVAQHLRVNGVDVFRTTPADESGLDPASLSCTDDPAGVCVQSPTLRMKDASESDVALTMGPNHAPNNDDYFLRPVQTHVGQPVQLGIVKLGGVQPDPDGDLVTERLSAEFDYPCAQSDPADRAFRCSAVLFDPAAGTVRTVYGPMGGPGPHGGWVYDLTGGTAVWNTPGTYRYTFTRTDAYGLSVSQSADVQVLPNAPSLAATCSACDVQSGKPVTVTGTIGLGATRDGDAVTIAWGDGTSTSGVPTAVFQPPGTIKIGGTPPVRTVTLPSGMVVTLVDSTTMQFSATHTYADQSGVSAAVQTPKITVTDTDSGDGSRSVPLTARIVPATAPYLSRYSASGGPEGGTSSFTATVADGNAADAGTATVDWGDGTPLQTVPYQAPAAGGQLNATHVYADDSPAFKTVTVVATDQTGLRGTAGQVVLTVTPAAPALTAVTASATTVAEGSPITVTGLVTDAGILDSGTVTVRWSDGTPDQTVPYGAPGASQAGGRFTATHVFADDKDPAISDRSTRFFVYARDKELQPGAVPVGLTTTVTNAAPTVSGLAVQPAVVGATARLQATVTDPGVRDTGSALVDWGDGGSRQTVAYPAGGGALVLAHVYGAPGPVGGGPFRVTVTATDQEGASGPAAVTTVAITGGPPPVTPPSVTSVRVAPSAEGSPATLSAVLADASPGDDGTATVDWGDGSPVQTLPYAAPSAGGALTGTHTYADDQAGGYAVIVTPTDRTGATGSPATTTAQVTGVAPTVASSSVSASSEGTAATLTATVADPGVKDSGTAVVDWGDGSAKQSVPYAAVSTPGAKVTASHTYADDKGGPFTVRVTPTDEDGLAGTTATARAVVSDVAPTVGAPVLRDPFGVVLGQGATAVVVGVPELVTAPLGDVGVRDVLRGRVTWGDGAVTDLVRTGGTGTGLHVWTRPGTYQVTVTVTDDSGLSAARTVPVTVQSVVDAGAALSAAITASSRAAGTSPSRASALAAAATALSGSSPTDPAGALYRLAHGQVRAGAGRLLDAFTALQTAQGSTPRADITAEQRQLVLLAGSTAGTAVAAHPTSAGARALLDATVALARGDLRTAMTRYTDATATAAP